MKVELDDDEGREEIKRSGHQHLELNRAISSQQAAISQHGVSHHGNWT